MPTLKVGTILPTPEEDAVINAGAAVDPDNSEWTDEEFAKAEFVTARSGLTWKRRVFRGSLEALLLITSDYCVELVSSKMTLK